MLRLRKACSSGIITQPLRGHLAFSAPVPFLPSRHWSDFAIFIPWPFLCLALRESKKFCLNGAPLWHLSAMGECLTVAF